MAEHDARGGVEQLVALREAAFRHVGHRVVLAGERTGLGSPR